MHGLAEPARPPLDLDELRRFLDHLDREFSRPLETLQAGLGRVAARDESEAVRTLNFLCADARSLPGQFRDYLLFSLSGHPPDLRPMRIGGLLDEIDRLFAPEAAARSQCWDCSLDGPDAEVQADRELCVEVLRHLASNAVTYSPEGSTIRVSAGRSDGSWRMIVVDDGPGIPAGHRDRILQPFQRLGREIRAEIPGAGLGLARSVAAVERLGGAISIDSPPRGGTRVMVELPQR